LKNPFAIPRHFDMLHDPGKLFNKFHISKFSDHMENREIVDYLLNQYEKILKNHVPVAGKDKRTFNPDYLDNLYRLGLFSVVLPEKLGGLSLDPVDLSFLLMKIAERDGLLASLLLDHSFALYAIIASVDSSGACIEELVEKQVIFSSNLFLNGVFEDGLFVSGPHFSMIPEEISRYVVSRKKAGDGDIVAIFACNDTPDQFAPSCVNILRKKSKNSNHSNDKTEKSYIERFKIIDIKNLKSSLCMCVVAVVAGQALNAIRQYLTWARGRLLFGKSLACSQLIQLNTVRSFVRYQALCGIYAYLLDNQNRSGAFLSDAPVLLARFAGRTGFAVMDSLLHLYGGTGYFEETNIPSHLRMLRYLSLCFDGDADDAWMSKVKSILIAANPGGAGADNADLSTQRFAEVHQGLFFLNNEFGEEEKYISEGWMHYFLRLLSDVEDPDAIALYKKMATLESL